MLSEPEPRVRQLALDFDFPTSLAFTPDGTAYVAESGLPFGGAPAGGRVWAIDQSGERSLVVDGLRPPVTGLTPYGDALLLSEALPGIVRQECDHRQPDHRTRQRLHSLPSPVRKSLTTSHRRHIWLARLRRHGRHDRVKNMVCESFLGVCSGQAARWARWVRSWKAAW
jgi:hypothetical protein